MVSTASRSVIVVDYIGIWATFGDFDFLTNLLYKNYQDQLVLFVSYHIHLPLIPRVSWNKCYCPQIRGNRNEGLKH